jgi:hypothetical protein
VFKDLIESIAGRDLDTVSGKVLNEGVICYSCCGFAVFVGGTKARRESSVKEG